MNLRYYTFALNAGVTSDPVNISGDRFIVLEATTEVRVLFDGAAGVPCDKGLKYSEGYRGFQIENNTAQAVVVRVLAGYGDLVDNRPGVRPQIASTAVRLAQSAVPNVHTLFANANPNRVEIIVQAASSNTGVVYLSASNSSGGQFAFIVAGEKFRMNYTGQVWAAAPVITDSITVSETTY